MFTHLHTHSWYSFSRGTIPSEALAELAATAGMTAIAQTDTNNLSGAVEFYIATKKHGIKPIIGVELRTRHETATLLARNADGYREICETVTAVLEAIPQTKPKLTLESEEPGQVEIQEEDLEYKPLAPFLHDRSEDIVMLSSSSTLLEQLAPQMKIGNLFMELAPHERKQWKKLRTIYRQYRLPVVATNDILFAKREDHALHKLLRTIGSNTTLNTVPEWEVGAESQRFTNEHELRALLSDVGEDAFANAQKIAESCNVEFDFSYSKFTKYPVEDSAIFLHALAEAGFRKRFDRPTAEHHARFEQELATIIELRATDYYLAVWDMIQFAKRKNFPYLGRGSGANSLIAYCLEISNVDPVRNHLRFERFLNPERSMPPDFDIDFSWKDRYEVIHYMIDTFGQNRSIGQSRAAMLCTVQCYRDRGAVRETGKAFGFTEAEINEQMTHIRTIYVEGKVASRSSALNEGNRPADIKQWMQCAARIESFPRNLSVHAGGLLIADRAMTHYTPVQMAPIGVPITQQDMYSADDWKLIKLDILATRGLGTYWDTMRLVEGRTGTRPPVENENVAFADEQTKELIRTGKTRGCFYIESPAMIGLLRKLRTDTFENLTAASSVIRPGVAQSGMMQEFIARHRDPARRNRADPILARLMPETYGVMVYQEDVLTVAHDVAGLSYGEADLMRRAMSGKTRSHERMTDLKDRFLDGCKSKGVHDAIAQEIWRQIISFSGYSFCKAHSASYAVLSFQEAWLKVYHPAEFLCSVLNNQGGFYRHQEYLNEARLLGITVKLPDVNLSHYEHTVDDERSIRLGFVAFSDLSSASRERLLAARAGAPFTSIEDFAIRSGVTMEDGALLVTLGACDSFGTRRVEMLVRFRAAMLGTSHLHKLSGQPGLGFADDLSHISLQHLSDYDPLYQFRLERNTFGYSVTNHPCDFLKQYAEGTVRASDLARHIGKRVTVVGAKAATKAVRTKRGELMLMLNLSDKSGMMDVVVWPEQYRQYYTQLSTAEAVRIAGKVAESYNVATLEAHAIEKLEFLD
ncbi:MAG: DNA polymerase III subunit alpha [Bacteroidota bacterium]|nr:DNA polymerase III subunit alpha [Bacteroidota bacterium]MDP4233068.1 DNA polymerase III subunit alpha [Bacteroidota bacterium]MDP4241787.1 DNA polymerase III subunit alpha [Bacteroidota bacterium]